MAKQNETRTFTIECSNRICKTRAEVEMVAMFAIGSERTEWHGQCRDGHDLVLHTPEAFETEDKPEIVQNVQVAILDTDDNAVNLATDVARRAMMDAGLPVGPTTPVELGPFEGDYLVDLPMAFYDDLEESGEDFWAETGDLIVTVTVP